jgi:hypothetical protein
LCVHEPAAVLREVDDEVLKQRIPEIKRDRTAGGQHVERIQDPTTEFVEVFEETHPRTIFSSVLGEGVVEEPGVR